MGYGLWKINQLRKRLQTQQIDREWHLIGWVVVLTGVGDSNFRVWHGTHEPSSRKQDKWKISDDGQLLLTVVADSLQADRNTTRWSIEATRHKISKNKAREVNTTAAQFLRRPSSFRIHLKVCQTGPK
jgi:hypothetical protein